MKLRFEDWIKANKFPASIEEILDDAVICYKNNVSRAALLLSYIAFMNILRNRILLSRRPNLFPDGEWRQLQKNVTKDDSWESAVFDATQQQEKIDNAKKRTKDPVFSINESIRKQISYWKDRRNDCAHFKNNHIDTFHVDAFWAFLESNLSKITIEGGQQSLLDKFAIHFDVKFTPKGKDVTPLIKEIEYSVEDTELNNFWKLLFSVVDNTYDLMPCDELLSLIEKIITNTTDKIQRSLLNFLITEKTLLYDYLSKYPQRIVCLGFDNCQVRSFWKTEILKCDRCLDIYAYMLNANLIPQDEINESHEHIIANIKQYKLQQNSYLILQGSNFNHLFEEYYFKQAEFKYYQTTNNRADLLYGYLLYNDFTVNIVDVLCAEYSKSIYYSEWLLKNLKRLFTEDINKKTMFIDIANVNKIVIPKLLNDIIN